MMHAAPASPPVQSGGCSADRADVDLGASGADNAGKPHAAATAEEIQAEKPRLQLGMERVAPDGRGRRGVATAARANRERRSPASKAARAPSAGARTRALSSDEGDAAPARAAGAATAASPSARCMSCADCRRPAGDATRLTRTKCVGERRARRTQDRRRPARRPRRAASRRDEYDRSHGRRVGVRGRGRRRPTLGRPMAAGLPPPRDRAAARAYPATWLGRRRSAPSPPRAWATSSAAVVVDGGAAAVARARRRGARRGWTRSVVRPAGSPRRLEEHDDDRRGAPRRRHDGISDRRRAFDRDREQDDGRRARGRVARSTTWTPPPALLDAPLARGAARRERARAVPRVAPAEGSRRGPPDEARAGSARAPRSRRCCTRRTRHGRAAPGRRTARAPCATAPRRARVRRTRARYESSGRVRGAPAPRLASASPTKRRGSKNFQADDAGRGPPELALVWRAGGALPDLVRGRDVMRGGARHGASRRSARARGHRAAWPARRCRGVARARALVRRYAIAAEGDAIVAQPRGRRGRAPFQRPRARRRAMPELELDRESSRPCAPGRARRACGVGARAVASSSQSPPRRGALAPFFRGGSRRRRAAPEPLRAAPAARRRRERGAARRGGARLGRRRVIVFTHALEGRSSLRAGPRGGPGETRRAERIVGEKARSGEARAGGSDRAADIGRSAGGRARRDPRVPRVHGRRRLGGAQDRRRAVARADRRRPLETPRRWTARAAAAGRLRVAACLIGAVVAQLKARASPALDRAGALGAALRIAGGRTEVRPGAARRIRRARAEPPRGHLPGWRPADASCGVGVQTHRAARRAPPSRVADAHGGGIRPEANRRAHSVGDRPDVGEKSGRRCRSPGARARGASARAARAITRPAAAREAAAGSVGAGVARAAGASGPRRSFDGGDPERSQSARSWAAAPAISGATSPKALDVAADGAAWRGAAGAEARSRKRGRRGRVFRPASPSTRRARATIVAGGGPATPAGAPPRRGAGSRRRGDGGGGRRLLSARSRRPPRVGARRARVRRTPRAATLPRAARSRRRAEKGARRPYAEAGARTATKNEARFYAPLRRGAGAERNRRRRRRRTFLPRIAPSRLEGVRCWADDHREDRRGAGAAPRWRSTPP